MKHAINSGTLLDEFLRDYMGQPITLILESGVHLKGKLVDFDPAHIQLETCMYSPDKKTPQEYLQNKSKVSGAIPQVPLSKSSNSPNKYSYHVEHLLSDFLQNNCDKPITMFLSTRYPLCGTLKAFDNAYVKVLTRAYGNEENNELPCVQALSVVSGFLAGLHKIGR